MFFKFVLRRELEKMFVVICLQAEQEALGTVCADGESALGEPRSSGPAGQAATIRSPTETDCHRGHGAPLLL